MIKKTVYRSLERRVRGEDDKIPPIKTVSPDLLLDALRNMDIRVRSVICAHLCTAERLAHSARTGQNEWRASQSGRRSELRGVRPVPPPPDRHVLSTRTSGTSRRRTESPSWFEKQALTGTYPSTP